MAKTSGMGDQLYLSGVNLSGDTGSIDEISGGPATIDVTGIDKFAHERIGGQRGGQISFSAFWDTATIAQGGYTGAHAALSALPTGDVIATYLRGQALGNPGACMVAKQISYDPTRATDGAITEKIQLQSNGYGLEWGYQGTPGIRADTTTTNGSGVDFQATSIGTAALSFGLQAYLQVFSLTGTSCTVKLQGSPDNSTWTDIVGGGFVAATAAGAQRIATAGNLAVARYFRVVSSGTFTQCSFAVVVVPNLATPSF